MDRRNILGLSVITAVGLILLPVSAFAQQKPLKEQLVGTWTVVSWDQATKDGSQPCRQPPGCMVRQMLHEHAAALSAADRANRSRACNVRNRRH
jgi:hypothetical protein